jgi:hypothetical protein
MKEKTAEDLGYGICGFIGIIKDDKATGRSPSVRKATALRLKHLQLQPEATGRVTKKAGPR